ncbi:hypothetical protein Tco_1004517 [Tanacetum coccineum]|uniref:Uncharacterized protein n=1 Tax=Tanacetum coccineum TaxID=301880 RepID=A0ABQ5FD38_9ASTR
MANVMSEGILAIWSHLRSAPYPWGGKSLQLLRKLGSHNRWFLKEPLALECMENPENRLRLILTFESETPLLETGFKFLRVCLSSQLDLPERATDDGLISRHLSTVLVSSVDPSWRKSEASDVNGLYRCIDDVMIKTTDIWCVTYIFSLRINKMVFISRLCSSLPVLLQKADYLRLWDHLRSNVDLYTQSKESRPDEVAKQKPKESFLNLHNESERIKSDKFSKSRRSKDWKSTIRDPDEPPPLSQRGDS